MTKVIKLTNADIQARVLKHSKDKIASHFKPTPDHIVTPVTPITTPTEETPSHG